MPAYNLGTAHGKIDIDTSNLALMRGTLNNAGTMLLGLGTAAAAGFGLAVKEAAAFEKQLDAFGAITNATEQDMEAVRQKALDLGKASAFGATEVSKAFVELGKAGVAARDITAGVGDAVIQLASAADISASKSSEVIVNTMKTFQLASKDAVKIANVLAGAANASTIDIQDLALSMKYAGGVASTMGLSMEDTASAIAVLGNAGIKGSTAGTSLRQMLLSLAPTSKKAAEMMKELGLITEDGGNKFFNAKGELKSMAEVTQILHDATKQLTPMQQEMAFKTIFQNRAMASAIILSREGAQAVNEMTAEISKTSALDVMNKRLDNLDGSLKKFKAALQSAMIEQGTAAQKPLQDLVERMTDLVNAFGQLDPKTQEMVVRIGLAVAAFGLLAGAMLKTAAAAIKLMEDLKKLHGTVKFLNAMVGIKARAAWDSFRFGLFAVRFFIQTSLIPTLASLWGFLLANPIVLVVAAVAALIAGLVILYKKWEPFRNVVDSTWQALQKLWDIILGAGQAALNWLKDNWGKALLVLLTGPIGLAIVAWQTFGDDIINFFQALPGRVVGALSKLGGFIVDALAKAGNFLLDFFIKLPGRVLDGLTKLNEAIIDFFVKLPGRLAFALGFLIGFILRTFIVMIGGIVMLFINFGPKIFGLFLEVMGFLIKAAVQGFEILWNFWTSIPEKLLDVIVKLGPMMWDAFWKVLVFIGDAVIRGFDIVFGFFRDLPGKILDIVLTLGPWLFETFLDIVLGIPDAFEIGFKAVWDFFIGLPGEAWRFLRTFGPWLMETFRVFAVNAVNSLKNSFNAIFDFFRELPTKIFDLIKGLAGDAFDWFKDIGDSFWKGFKKGIGIGSPSYIERAMFQIVENMTKSTDQVQAEMDRLNAMGKQLTLPKVDLTQQAGAGAPTATYIAPKAPVPGEFAPAGTTTTGGDTFYIMHAEQKTAREISQEIISDKRVRLRS